MPGGGGTSSTETSTRPWGPVKAPLKTNINTAFDLSRTPMPYYPGQTVAGMSPDTAAALGMTRDLAGTNWSASALPTASLLSSGGYQDLGQNPFWSSGIGGQALGALSGSLSGNPWASAGLAQGPGAAGVGSLLGQTGPGRDYGQIGEWLWGSSAPGSAMTDALVGSAAGNYLDPASNPTWQNYSNAVADTVKRATDARYLSAGQNLDNPSSAQTFARDFGSVMAPYASQMYGDERARQLQSASAIGNLLNSGSSLAEQGYQSQAGRQLQAGNVLANLGSTGDDQINRATALLANIYGTNTASQLSALGMTPELAKNSYLPASMLQAAGQAGEGYQLADMNDALKRYQYGQMEPWQRVFMLNQALQPALGYGTQSSTTQQPGVNTASSIMGGLGSLAGAAMLFTPAAPFAGIPFGLSGMSGALAQPGLFGQQMSAYGPGGFGL